jgi:hypothetical protein
MRDETKVKVRGGETLVEVRGDVLVYSIYKL